MEQGIPGFGAYSIGESDLTPYREGKLGEGEPINVSLTELAGCVEGVEVHEAYTLVMGGTNLEVRKVCVQNGKITFEEVDEFPPVNLDEGGTENDYINTMQRLAGKNVPIFLNVAGPVTDTYWHPTNLPVLRKWFQREYDCNFEAIFGENLVGIVNDAPAALLSSIYQIIQKDGIDAVMDKHFFLQIIGTGNGFCIFVNKLDGGGAIIPLEAGHLGNLEWLDIADVAEATSLSGKHKGIETVVAGRGVVAIYEELGEDKGLTAKEIGELIGQNIRADMAFNLSAAAAARQIAGIAKAYGLPVNKIVTVFRGGITRARGYIETVQYHIQHFGGLASVESAGNLTTVVDHQGAVINGLLNS